MYNNIIERKELTLYAGHYPTGHGLAENKKIANRMAFVLDDLYPDKDIRLICRGSSGNLMAAYCSVFCVLCNIKEIESVMKDGENAHRNNFHNKQEDTLNIIIDDFVNTGRTISEIYTKYKNNNPGVYIDAIIVNGNIDSWTSYNRENIIVGNIICGVWGVF